MNVNQKTPAMKTFECPDCGEETTDYVVFKGKKSICLTCLSQISCIAFFAERLFEGFCNYFGSLGITESSELSKDTHRLYRFFDELGSMLGFKTSSEWTMGSLMQVFKADEVPTEIKGKRIDMIWYAKHLYLFSAFELEHSISIERIRADIRKLAASGAELAVLYCPSVNRDDIVKTAQEDMKPFYKGKKRFIMLLLDPWKDPGTFDSGELEALLIDERGEKLCEGKASVAVEEKSGIRMFTNSEWSCK